ncbi:growth-regulating factor 1-like [Euphorbia lathyris]|uniref:growth-regulating factor 1-like n=1 Tax=Euphorbia lathyris TaxID=212925 RepID=UPI0033132A91
MDFGVVGLEGLVGSENTSCGFGSDRGTKQERYGSGFLKQERSDTVEDDWRSSKLSKTESMLLPQRQSLLKSNNTASTLFPYVQHQHQQQQQQMLSFSSPKSEPQNLTLPGFQLISYAYNRSTGSNYENLNSGNMHGVYTETRGPFTPSQWMELEHQALIYKYITANVPIPSNLLIPIRRALESSAISTYSGGLLRPNALSWGGFHLGFSSNTDPEPGRCRRTDGKKWRCSRDAVADQKYCERHMNRGRHRSRKHVEGQSGHSSAAATSSITSKPMLTASSTSSVSASAVGLHGSSASKSLAIAQNQQQLKNLQSENSSNLSAATSLNRMFLSKENMGERVQDSPGLSTLSSKINLKSKENPFMILKQQSPYQESSQLEFGRVNSDSLLNPSHNGSSVITCRNFESSEDITEQQNIQQRSIRQFMDDWPRSQSDQTDGLWPQLDVQTDRTQLSISIPVAPTDFMSSTSSPNNDKSALSPLRLSCELDLNAFNQRQTNWIPVPWESSMGGPLGEVLHSGSECKSSSVITHLKEGWDSSPRLGSSPTGVLQKPTFGSLSNSSAGSSPRADRHRTNEGASMCCDFLAPV